MVNTSTWAEHWINFTNIPHHVSLNLDFCDFQLQTCYQTNHKRISSFIFMFEQSFEYDGHDRQRYTQMDSNSTWTGTQLVATFNLHPCVNQSQFFPDLDFPLTHRKTCQRLERECVCVCPLRMAKPVCLHKHFQIPVAPSRPISMLAISQLP